MKGNGRHMLRTYILVSHFCLLSRSPNAATSLVHIYNIGHLLYMTIGLARPIVTSLELGSR